MKNWTTLIPIQLKMVWWHTISTLSSEIDSLFSSGWFTGQGNFLFIYTRPSLNDVRQLNLPGGWGGALLLLGGRLINGCVDDNMGDMVDQSVNRVRLNVLIECLIGPFCLKNSNNNGTEMNSWTGGDPSNNNHYLESRGELALSPCRWCCDHDLFNRGD